jgi:NADH:ubiquinone oxidoreductase subunit 3 (subunit A)
VRDQRLLEGLSNFALLLVFAAVVAMVIMALSNELAPKGADSPGKLAPYACGEDVQPAKVRLNVENFFIYTVYFMIFDVLGFVMATTIARPTNVMVPLAYAAASLISIVILAAKWRL